MVAKAVNRQDFAQFDSPLLRKHGIIIETAASPAGETLTAIFPEGKYNVRGLGESLKSSIKERPELPRLLRFLERKAYPKEREERQKNRLFKLTGEPSVEQGYIRIGQTDYFVVANFRRHSAHGTISVDFYKTTAIRKMPRKYGDLTASASIYFNAHGDNKTHVTVWNPLREEATTLMRFLMHDSLVIPQ
jgi:hypothetical protein